jgi:hypothetical protein
MPTSACESNELQKRQKANNKGKDIPLKKLLPSIQLIGRRRYLIDIQHLQRYKGIYELAISSWTGEGDSMV